ncbi:MAG: hypothetical protein BWY66_02401 [bacterium ADurb.Bin374]|nr:MAG: hypothetical protein BWY66_02401 [bacterium ADurb.Bin374]
MRETAMRAATAAFTPEPSPSESRIVVASGVRSTLQTSPQAAARFFAELAASTST